MMNQKYTFRFQILIFCVFLVAGFLTFHSGLNNPFMIDDYHIFDNQKRNIKFIFNQFIPDRLQALKIESQELDSYYRPFSHVLFMMLYWAFENNTFYYHAFNLVIFSVVAFLVYRFVSFLFGGFWLGFLTGLFYLVHPINGIMVNYITAVYFSFEVIFMVLSLWALLGNSRRATALSLFWFFMAMMSHETAMALPFYAAFLLRTVRREQWSLIAQKLFPFAVLLIGYFLFRMRFASFNASLFGNLQYMHINLWQFLATTAKSIFWYLAQLVSPTEVLFANVTVIVRDSVGIWLFVFAGMLAIFLVLVKYTKGQSWSLLGLQWFFVGFLPLGAACLTIPQFGLLIEPHWFIFSCIGFFLFLAGIFEKISQKHKIIFITCVCGVVLPWMITAQAYNYLWSNEKLYTRYWLEAVPHFKRINNHLAKAYVNEGDFEHARFYYHQGIEGTSRDWQNYANIGSLYLMEGNISLAKKNLLMADKIDSNRGIVLNSLGVIAIKENEMSKAKEYFMKAAQLNPFSISSRLNLAKIYAAENNFPDAIKIYRQVLEIAPHNKSAQLAITQIYNQTGKTKEALEMTRHLSPREGSQTLNKGLLTIK